MAAVSVSYTWIKLVTVKAQAPIEDFFTVLHVIRKQSCDVRQSWKEKNVALYGRSEEFQMR